MTFYIHFSPGNCPLGQALPRLKTLYPQAKVMSVLSLAPPAQKHSKKLEELKTQWEKNAKMGKYLITYSNDGWRSSVQNCQR